VNDAADELLAGMRAGTIRTRSGDPYKPSAVRGYDAVLRDHLRPALGAMQLGEVVRRHVQQLADRLVADGFSPSTVRNALMPLRVIFRRAIRDELVLVNPCAGIDLPANRGRRDRIVGVDTAAQLIAVLPTPFDRALWATVLYAGLRRGELLALRWGDVDLGNGFLRVERAYDPPSRSYVPPKSRAGVRRAPITEPGVGY
jgi:integrase